MKPAAVVLRACVAGLLAVGAASCGADTANLVAPAPIDAGADAASHGCRPAGEMCSTLANCCSRSCVMGVCMGNGVSCTTVGGMCGDNDECCSTRCELPVTTCEGLPDCLAFGEPCGADAECCGLSCDATGYCANLFGCKPATEPCVIDSDCCSADCKERGNYKTCEPQAGCLVSGPVETPLGILNEFGERCALPADCCSGRCEADFDGWLRCRKAGDPRCDAMTPVCLPLQELCDEACQCCSASCMPDGAGVFRCVP